MFENTNLKNYLEQSSSVKLKSVILAEWNMNFLDNIVTVGNYKNRPKPTAVPASSTYVFEDSSTASPTWYGYTDSTLVINSGLTTEAGTTPTVFLKRNETEKVLYSLSECLGRFRPRSGINKIRYFKTNYINNSNPNMHSQPRYYLSSKDDKFKYWSSYRIEPSGTVGIERGISNQSKTQGEYYLDDAAPFVKYANPVPANRIVVKMQTHAGDLDRGLFKKSTLKSFTDPFYENPDNTGALVNQQTPVDWKIEYLDNNDNWQTALSFDNTSLRSTGKRVIGSDGYVELSYGITNTLPSGFRELGQYPSQASLPVSGDIGDAYLVPDPANITAGTYYVWNGTNWTTNSFVPTYGWKLNEETQTVQTSLLTSLTSPETYGSVSNIYTANYRRFKFIKGIRIVVNTMSQINSAFELIEMSPRLVADLSDKTVDYSITKIASDIGNTGIAVGSLSASTGQITLFDYDESFNQYNTLRIPEGTNTVLGSLIANISSKNLQFKFLEQIIDNRTTNLVDYFVPIKTMYVDGFPTTNKQDRKTSIELRDLFFYFESVIAPSLLMKNVKVSKAIATLLDNIGFSNYIFYRNEDENEDVIPYFYIAPDTNVAEILNDIARSTQTCMFFDEYNNFVTMSKNYIMPTEEQRETDIELYGTKDFSDTGVEKNDTTNNAILANIIDITSEDDQIFNGGKVVYSNKYIQKSYGTIQEASMLNNNQSYKYKPVLLWEVAGTENLRSINEEGGTQSSYVLGALPLNSEVSNYLPSTNPEGIMKNNIIDFGQSVYWLTRYEGYFYANGEIIKYKGVEHTIQSPTITGLVATLTADSRKVRLTTGNIFTLSVGQKLRKKTGGSGNGVFGTDSTITGIDRKKQIITVKDPIVTTGSGTQIEAYFPSTNVWIESQNDYSDYLAKVPFNGKIFPTGNVKIYAEPTYDSSGNLKTNSATITSIQTTANSQTVKFTAANKFILGQHVAISVSSVTGTTVGGLTAANLTRRYRVVAVASDGTTFDAKPFENFSTTPTSQTKVAAGTVSAGSVASKHGRMQFGTGVYSKNDNSLIPATHKVMDQNNEWITNTPKTFKMESSWLFTGSHEYKQNKITLSATGGASGQKDITYVSADTTAPISKGWFVSGTGIASDSVVDKKTSTTITLNKNLTAGVTGNTITFVDKLLNTPLTVSAISSISAKPIVDFKIKDIFDTSNFKESSGSSTVNDTVGKGSSQVSALVLNGVAESGNPTNNYLSYVYKNIETEAPNANVFGTRMRILGTSSKTSQSPLGAALIDTVQNNDSSYIITGTGGGIAIYLDTSKNTNTGYYFEITALSSQTILEQTNSNNTLDTIPNVFFYKVLKNSNNVAVPVSLWYGNAPILVDSGLFPGMGRTTGEGATTVYDLSIKTEKIGSSRKFYLYINNKLIATVTDTDPIKSIPENKNIGLFVRGKGKSMFENVYAIQDSSFSQFETPNSHQDKVLGITKETFNPDAYRKNLVNPGVIESFISGISTSKETTTNLYYEEFGTIMRECAYFNVKYDKAYPALYSKISPTFNDKQGYIVSGFRSNPYTAEFLVFNVTDFALVLDESSGNYLRIQGITFTQQSSHDLTVDEYLSKTSSLKNYNKYSSMNNKYLDIQNSRNTYGKKDFTIDGTYIQNIDMANNLMQWMVDKVMVPKKSICLSIFANPMIQLGDIVKVNYAVDGIQQVPSSRFVVYHIEYQRASDGPSMTLYLSEVV